MQTILILGGTGTTGRRIARQLRSTQHTVRTAARRGADVRLDLDDPTTWEPVLAGVTAAYLMEPTLQAGPRLADFTKAAVAAGVRRFVMLSAARAEEESHPLHAAEQAVRTSDAEWTILHPNWFAQNFSEGPWARAIADGTLALPTGDGRTPFVDAEDIAAVAAAALTTEGHHGVVYALTGPAAISFGEATELIGRATGRRIEYVDLSPEDYTQRQRENGVPAPAAHLLTSILVSIRDGWAESCSDDIPRALGRPATSFETYVARAAGEGHFRH
ncbi:uncharacterized protein YbjT (DUF2867 family) [Kribbella voronezhensis]|uniref:Uncharacterized protein YbjT (DUF2867 family) n=1 Tax=Kribbella voronezhensis TaxID=2512212 RepID=A0A4R7SYC3_9ACTN|nr:NAD(P)H-binding protein [Kribbella voronezhensis]TDU84314.1 uncharacterized protein YbjT (DUF2867 family) [Kribbella voronezhensis]